MRSALVALAGTAILAVSLSGCAGQSEAPATGQSQAPASGEPAVPESGSPAEQAGAGEQAGSATDELAKITSTLDAIDSEFASDGSP